MTILSGFAPLVLASGACAPTPQGEVRSLELSDPLTRWGQPGTFEIVPPIYIPQPEAGSVTIWLALPESSSLLARASTDGRTVLDYPPGTVSDRVEVWEDDNGRRVIDVRGTRIDESGRRWHHVYRPTTKDPSEPLVGVEWPADDPEQHALATELFLDRLEQGGVHKGLRDIASKLDCDGCHLVDRPESRRRGEFGTVARGTDGAGFFTPSTLLGEEGVIERYGAHDLNREDPYIVISCAEECTDASVFRGHLSLETALTAGDAHALAFCASRNTLTAHLPSNSYPRSACEGRP